MGEWEVKFVEEELRNKLNQYALEYGTNDERTLKISQQLDPFMTKGQKKYGSN